MTVCSLPRRGAETNDNFFSSFLLLGSWISDRSQILEISPWFGVSGILVGGYGWVGLDDLRGISSADFVVSFGMGRTVVSK